MSVHIFGAEVLALSWGEQDQADEPGECTAYPVGFVASAGDQRWEQSPELS